MAKRKCNLKAKQKITWTILILLLLYGVGNSIAQAEGNKKESFGKYNSDGYPIVAGKYEVKEIELQGGHKVCEDCRPSRIIEIRQEGDNLIFYNDEGNEIWDQSVFEKTGEFAVFSIDTEYKVTSLGKPYIFRSDFSVSGMFSKSGFKAKKTLKFINYSDGETKENKEEYLLEGHKIK